MVFRPYRRLNAVLYAHRWAYGRDPQFYNYEAIGGDCTNFASQCIYAGTGVMNETPLYGWYYINANNKSPSWTGVEYLYDFLTPGIAGPRGACHDRPAGRPAGRCDPAPVQRQYFPALAGGGAVQR